MSTLYNSQFYIRKMVLSQTARFGLGAFLVVVLQTRMHNEEIAWIVLENIEGNGKEFH